jgi:hypothetical protein
VKKKRAKEQCVASLVFVFTGDALVPLRIKVKEANKHGDEELSEEQREPNVKRFGRRIPDVHEKEKNWTGKSLKTRGVFAFPFTRGARFDLLRERERGSPFGEDNTVPAS